MNQRAMIPILFVAAALYDAVLGIAFLLAPGRLFAWLDVTPPNHPGYVQFPAALLIIFSLMFASIAGDPAGRRSLIPYGILLKVAYCGVVLFHWLSAGLPWIWKPFCIADLCFLVLFIWAWALLGKRLPESG